MSSTQTVLLDIYTCADLADEYTRNSDDNSNAAVYRRTRARESLLLAICLHEAGVLTWSLPNEPLIHMLRLVDPKQIDNPKTHFTVVFVNLVKEKALPRWHPIFSMPGDEDLKGSGCDDFLIEVARQNDVPLVTKEGYSADGIDDAHGMRRKARSAGVRVFTPRAYWSGKLNPKRAARRFLQDFRAGVPRFLKLPAGANRGRVAEVLAWIAGYFHHVLYGIAADGTSRVRVEL